MVERTVNSQQEFRFRNVILTLPSFVTVDVCVCLCCWSCCNIWGICLACICFFSPSNDSWIKFQPLNHQDKMGMENRWLDDYCAICCVLFIWVSFYYMLRPDKSQMIYLTSVLSSWEFCFKIELKFLLKLLAKRQAKEILQNLVSKSMFLSSLPSCSVFKKSFCDHMMVFSNKCHIW